MVSSRKTAELTHLVSQSEFVHVEVILLRETWLLVDADGKAIHVDEYNGFRGHPLDLRNRRNDIMVSVCCRWCKSPCTLLHFTSSKIDCSSTCRKPLTLPSYCHIIPANIDVTSDTQVHDLR